MFTAIPSERQILWTGPACRILNRAKTQHSHEISNYSCRNGYQEMHIKPSIVSVDKSIGTCILLKPMLRKALPVIRITLTAQNITTSIPVVGAISPAC